VTLFRFAELQLKLRELKLDSRRSLFECMVVGQQRAQLVKAVHQQVRSRQIEGDLPALR